MDELKRLKRKKIDADQHSVSFLLTADLEKVPSFITPKDISETGISFETDTGLELNSNVDFVIKDKGSKEFCSMSGVVSRVDEIIEIDEPRKKFKIVVKFEPNSNILLKRIME